MRDRVRARNDPAQYDELAATWWDRRGPFAMLHWIAEARAALIPPPRRPGAALDVSRSHGLVPVRADARYLPLRDECADVVVAGECLEHVPEMSRVVAGLCRRLSPGGTLVLDTIASTAVARFLTVTLAERIPGGPPPGLHDPALFVDRESLVRECAAHGVDLRLTGLRPSASASVAWLLHRRTGSRMVATRSTAVLFQGCGIKRKESAR